MEKRFLDKIIWTIELSNREDLLGRTAEIKEAYKMNDLRTVIEKSYKILGDMSDDMLTMRNMQTPSGTAKMLGYLDLYNEIAAFAKIYSNK